MGIKFNGIPGENETFSVPDTKTKRSQHRSLNRDVEEALKGIRNLQNMSPEDFKHMLPKEILEDLEDQASQIGMDFDTLFSSAIDTSTKAIERMLSDESMAENMLNMIKGGQLPLDLSVFKTGIPGVNTCSGNSNNNSVDFVGNAYPGLDIFDILEAAGLDEDECEEITETVEEDLQDLENMINDCLNNQGLPTTTVAALAQQAYANQTPQNQVNQAQSSFESFIQSMTGGQIKEPVEFENGRIDYLMDPNKFGSIIYKRTPNLLDKFNETGIKRWEDFPKSTIIYSSEDAPMDLVDELKLVDSNDKYLLYYVKPKEDQGEESLGLYMAVIMGATGEFEVIIPEFGNTYTGFELYNCMETPELFNQRGEFRLFDIDKLHGELEVILVEEKHPILNAKGFGEITQQIVSPKSNNHLLKVGIIKSNESTEAILLKKDGELDLEKTSFPFVINFGEIVDSEVLGLISRWLSKVDLNNSALMNTLNLRTKHGEFIYVDMDLGTVIDNIYRWYRDEGNVK